MAKGKQNNVRFNLYLPLDTRDLMEKCQKEAGKPTIAETIRSALKVYWLLLAAMRTEGKQLCLVDKDGKVERVIGI